MNWATNGRDFWSGVATPRITDEFHAINDIGWYGAAYMLTACSFILVSYTTGYVTTSGY